MRGLSTLTERGSVPQGLSRVTTTTRDTIPTMWDGQKSTLANVPTWWNPTRSYARRAARL